MKSSRLTIALFLISAIAASLSGSLAQSPVTQQPSALPQEVTLKDEVRFNIKDNGVAIGFVNAKSGLTVKLLSVTNDTVVVEYNGNQAAIPKDKTDLAERIYKAVYGEKKALEEEARKNAEFLAQKNAEDTKKAAGAIQAAYDHAIFESEILKQEVNTFTNDDTSVTSEILGLTKSFINDFNSTPENERLKLVNTYLANRDSILLQKSITAFKKNEIMNKMLPVNMKYAIYNNADIFYIQTGDDPFCTMSDLRLDDILKLINADKKIDEWMQQCLKEKLDVNKPIGRFGQVTLNLISTDNSNTIAIRAEVIGDYGKDRMIKEQAVGLNYINWICLKARIWKTNDIVNAREKKKRDADRLR